MDEEFFTRIGTTILKFTAFPRKGSQVRGTGLRKKSLFFLMIYAKLNYYPIF